jgi:branched-chain amino acid transport system permease protein
VSVLVSEAGQFSTSHRADARVFRLRQERWAVVALLTFAFLGVPLFGNDYWYTAILLPFLCLSLAGIGLNLLTGYAGQLSLGSAGFMAIGAYTAYNVQLRLPGTPLPLGFVAGGLAAAVVGVLAGLPSARIKGFYLVVSTLVLQFGSEWAFTRFGWFSNGNASGLVSAPALIVAGHDFGTPVGRYLLALAVVTVLAVLARRITGGELGRKWMAVRDMDTAAAVIGIPVLRAKLWAFGASSFYCGVAGALWGLVYLGTFDPRAFELTRSFQILFIIIIGGMGSILGNFLGAAFILLVPIAMSNLAGAYLKGAIDQGALENYKKIVFGVMIIVFLIKEPEGLARMWRTIRQRARIWPLRQW